MEEPVVETVWSDMRKEEAPVHAAQATYGNLSWCGRRPQFRHIVRPGTSEDVTCATCKRRLALGHPLSRGAR